MPDDTFVSPEDEEVARDEASDEFAPYFDGSSVPKIMITTRPRPSKSIFPLISELMSVIPNSFFYKRGMAWHGACRPPQVLRTGARPLSHRR